MRTEDIYVFNHQNFLKQLESAPKIRGYYRLQFYVDEKGELATTPTGNLRTFYYHPSGGTIRDENFVIVRYFARYDQFKKFSKTAS